MNNEYKTDFLFPKPTFLSGVARTLDIFGTNEPYNESSSPSEADKKAIASDWGNVAQDVYNVIINRCKR